MSGRAALIASLIALGYAAWVILDMIRCYRSARGFAYVAIPMSLFTGYVWWGPMGYNEADAVITGITFLVIVVGYAFRGSADFMPARMAFVLAFVVSLVGGGIPLLPFWDALFGVDRVPIPRILWAVAALVAALSVIAIQRRRSRRTTPAS